MKVQDKPVYLVENWIVPKYQGFTVFMKMTATGPTVQGWTIFPQTK